MDPYKKHTLYLLRCAVSGTKPDACHLQNLDLKKILIFSRFHSVSALVAYALTTMSDSSGLISQQQRELLSAEKSKAIRHFMMQNREADSICGALESAQIIYLPLKGCVISKYYPFGLREMSDIDILFDESRCDKTRSIMINLGYSVDDYGNLYHDTYHKEPLYCVELHRQLFNPLVFPVFTDFFSNCLERSVKISSRQYERAFSADVFFIFIVAHAVKHLNGPGTGIRTLADIYLTEKNEKLNEETLTNAFEKLEISKEASSLRSLAKAVFDPEADLDALSLSENDAKMLEFIFDSGTHGTFKHRIEKRYRLVTDSRKGSRGKLKYVRSRLSITPAQMEKKYPFFYRHKLARPFLIFKRLHVGLTKRKTALKEEISTIKKI